MSERAPTFAEVILRAVELGLARTHVALPAKIEKFDAATQLAAVQPYLKDTWEEEDGTETVMQIPVINNVPVQFPGGTDFVITFPVAVGDPCWLVFSDRSLEIWKQKGGIVDPVDLRRHHFSDAVALLGVRSKAGALAEFDSGAMRLGKVGGLGIRIKAGEVHLGVGHNTDATDAIALASKVNAELSKLKTAYDAHEHVVALGACTAGGNVGATATTGGPSAPALADVKSTKVKAV